MHLQQRPSKNFMSNYNKERAKNIKSSIIREHSLHKTLSQPKQLSCKVLPNTRIITILHFLGLLEITKQTCILTC